MKTPVREPQSVFQLLMEARSAFSPDEQWDQALVDTSPQVQASELAAETLVRVSKSQKRRKAKARSA